MATAEFALVLPLLVSVVALCLGAIACSVKQHEACVVARNAARAHALAGHGGRALTVPGTAQISVSMSEGVRWIHAEASVTPLARLGLPLRLHCDAWAVSEWVE